MTQPESERRFEWAGVGAALLAGWLLLAPRAGGNDPDSGSEPGPVIGQGWTVTTGAAPGYVDDRLCGRCHADLYESYQQVAMAKAFYRPGPERIIEDFENNRFFHRKSRRHYEMTVRDGGYFFARFQLDAAGRRVNVFEQKVDWILGSGSHSRTYLYRTPEGELYQLPLAWYSQTQSWGMAPGFDRADHQGVNRRVRRECIFCHNAYPDVAAGSDAYDTPQVFPEELPEGLGCQRCHGPGARHARIGMSENIDFQELAGSIVNPGRLPPELRNDICYGCHMQPSVVLPGVRRFGRGDYSFRPGEPLADYLVQVDVEEQGSERSERFEINHHAYRLEQSRCFVESEGAMSCLTCHDPHRKVPEAERPAHYRAACESCHATGSCRLDQMVASAKELALPAVDSGTCVGCHMENRRTQDVVQVVMTDHFIHRLPRGEKWLEPLDESVPDLVGVSFQDPDRAPGGVIGEIYRAAAVVRAGGGVEAIERLQGMLGKARVEEIDPYVDLLKGQIRQRRLAAAERTLDEIRKRLPDHARLSERQAVVLAGLGRREEALAALRQALEQHSERASVHFNLGRLVSTPSLEEAVSHFERALEIRPNMLMARFFLGDVQAELGNTDAALASYRRALEIDPGHVGSYLALGQLLVARGDREAAVLTLRQGLEHVARPEPIAKALARLSAASTESQ